MSSVNSASGRNDQNDEIRKMREDYRKKEAELIKKQNKEIAALNQKHDEELGKAEKQHASDLGVSREKTQEAITQRDAKYQKEIEDLRKMQAKQLERLTAENQVKIETQRSTSDSEKGDATLAKNDREQDLLKKYNQQASQYENKFADQVQTLRQDEAESINHQKEMLNKKHEAETNQMRDERNRRVAALESENRELYSTSSQRIKDQEVRHFADNRRMQDAHMATMRKEEMAQNQMNDENREGYQESVRDLRSRFAKEHDREVASGNSDREKFHSDVSGRIDGQVNRLEHELVQARDQNVLQETKSNAKNNREMRNLQDSYQTKYDILDKNKQQILDEANDRIAAKVKVVHGETDKQMATNTRYYIDQMEVGNFKNRQAREQMETDFAARQKYQEAQGNSRVDKIRGESQNAEIELKSNFDMNTEVQKAGFEEKKKDIVYNLEKDKNSSLSRLHNQALKQEVESQQTLASVVNKYEKRISEMSDQILRERRLRDNHERQVLKGLNREHETEMESLQMKYEDRAKQVEVAHNRDLKDVDRRSQQKLDEVLTSVKKQT